MFKIIGADGKEYGPVTPDLLRQWIAEGRLNAQTRVLPEGATEWKLLGDLPEFSSVLSGTAAAAATPGTISLPPVPRTNSMAVTAMIFGIISVTFGLCCYGLPFNLLGIIFAVIGLGQIKADPLNQRGSGMAIAGLILSIVSLLLGGLMLALYLAFGSSHLLHRIHRL
jgi:hypothetical protein